MRKSLSGGDEVYFISLNRKGGANRAFFGWAITVDIPQSFIPLSIQDIQYEDTVTFVQNRSSKNV